MSKNNFIYNNYIRHPSFVYDIKGDEFYYIPITHHDVYHGHRNIKLRENPNPKKLDEVAYISSFPYKDSRLNFDKKGPKKGWSFHLLDWLRVERVKREPARDRNAVEKEYLNSFNKK